MSAKDPKLVRAKGLHFLMRFFNGETIMDLVRSTGHHRTTIESYMKKAVDGLIDEAQDQLMKEVFPLVKELVKADLEHEIKQAREKGVKPDLRTAERILKGMFILDSEPTKNRLQAEVLPPPPKQLEEAPDSLEAVFVRAQRKQKPSLPQVSVIDVNSEKVNLPSDADLGEHHHESGEPNTSGSEGSGGDER